MANQTIYPFGTGGSLPADIGIINDLSTGGADKALSAEMGKFIGDTLGKSEIIESGFSALPKYKDGYQLKADSTQVGKDIDDVNTYASSIHHNVKIDVSQYDIVTFRQYGSAYNYGSLIVDDNDIVIQGIVLTTGTAVTLNVPSDAKYLIYSYVDSSYDKTVTLYKSEGIITKIDSLANKEDTVVSTSGSAPKLTPGKINAVGNIVSDSKCCFTETIFGPFYIELNEGWMIYEGHLFDKGGTLVSYQYIHPEVNGINRRTSSTKQIISIANVVPEYGVKLIIKKLDGSDILNTTNVVKNYVNLLDANLHRLIPDDLPNYALALRRIEYVQSLRWVPLAKVPNGYPSTNSTSATNVQNDYFDMPGQMAVGVPYSDVAETRTYVPNNVSIRTFLSAVHNRRSLLYTEELHKGVSKYGRTYKQGHRRAYYGEVCSGFTAWVMGLKTLYLSYAYDTDRLPGLSVVTGANASNVKPLDLLWWDGHVGIVSEVWLDEFNERKFVVIAEMTSPYPYRTIYTPEQFDYRMRNGEIHRWNGWVNLPELDEARDLSQYVLGDVRQEPSFNPDIMTYAGDYAAFAEGDVIHLNARRNSVYTGVELYKDDELLQTIDITGLSADTIVTPNTEDWVDVNLTTLNLTYGKYKARLTDGTNTTDYTYFEVVDITFYATKSGSTITAFFSSNQGTPVSLERVSDSGFADEYCPITAEMIEAGQTTAWARSSGHTNLQILVSGEYGDVTKIISIPTA